MILLLYWLNFEIVYKLYHVLFSVLISYAFLLSVWNVRIFCLGAKRRTSVAWTSRGVFFEILFIWRIGVLSYFSKLMQKSSTFNYAVTVGVQTV